MTTQKQRQKQKNKAAAETEVTLKFTDNGWDDYVYWSENDPNILKSINTLIEECKRTPFKGQGKPEQLKANLSGYWSRRITQEHRLVYMFSDGALFIIQCRYHY